MGSPALKTQVASPNIQHSRKIINLHQSPLYLGARQFERGWKEACWIDIGPLGWHRGLSLVRNAKEVEDF